MEGPFPVDNVPVADALLEVAVRTRHGGLRRLRAASNWFTLVSFYLLILLIKEKKKEYVISRGRFNLEFAFRAKYQSSFWVYMLFYLIRSIYVFKTWIICT